MTAPTNDRREVLAAVIRSVTDLWDEPLDEVHDIPPIVNAILAAQEADPEVEPLQRCRRCLVFCEPGMACVGDHPEEDAATPCRPVGDQP